MIYGYHRNQAKNQRLDIGKHAIEAFCKDNGYDLEKIYTDYAHWCLSLLTICEQLFESIDRPNYIVYNP